MNLKNAIPPRIWPALALLGLFLVVALACDSLGRDAERVGAELQQIAVWLAAAVIPFTMVSVWMSFLQGRSANQRGTLTGCSIGIRLGVSFVFAFLALILF